MSFSFEEIRKFTIWLWNEWEKPKTIFFLCLITTGFGLWILYQTDLIEIQNNITSGEFILLIAVVFLLWGIWFYTTRIPKVSPGMFGIIVAINCESDKERQRVKMDVVQALQAEINQESENYFQILQLSDFFSQKIKNDLEALHILKETKGHLILYGRVRSRLHEGKPHYVLNFREVVVHNPITPKMSKQFSKDMGLALPSTFKFSEEMEDIGFEATKETLSKAARWAIGISILFSGDPFTSFAIHKRLFNEVRKIAVNGLPKESIEASLKLRLEQLLVLSGINSFSKLYYEFINKDYSSVEKMAEYIELIREIEPHKYEVRNLYAIYLFLSSRKIMEAKRELKKAKNSRDSRWEFSLAFLEAYEGSLLKAHKTYQSAFRGDFPQSIPNDVENFIQNILEMEPDKIQLWYCLGMINYFCKKDLASAKRDFQEFINLSKKEGIFPEQVKYAEDTLGKI